MQHKFGVLRVVGTVFKVLGGIVLVLGVLSACGMIAVGAMPGLLGAGSRGTDALGLGVGGAIGGVIVGLGAIFFAILYFLLLYAFGDMIFLLISLEENTRLTAERLSSLPPLPPPPPSSIEPASKS